MWSVTKFLELSALSEEDKTGFDGYSVEIENGDGERETE
jgi:hypothetical protein